MLLAYIIYTLSMQLLVFAGYIRRCIKKNITIYIAICIVALILGLRYNVGNDYLPYKEIFVFQNFEAVEWGYALLNRVLYELGFHYTSIFILIAFLQFFFFYKGVEKYPSILPYAFFFYFTTIYIFFALNGMRQALAFSMFIYALSFIHEGKYWRYILILLIASSIHKSALILVPLVIFIDKNLFKNRVIQYSLFFLTFVYGKVFQNLIWSNFAFISSITGYGDYAEGIETLKQVNWAKNGGIGFILWMIVDCWVIYYYKKLVSCYKNTAILAFYNLYFIGLLLTNCIQGTYFDRANVYFSNMRIIIYAFFFLFIFEKNKSTYAIYNKFAALVLSVVLLVFFYMAIYNKAGMCAPFQFIF